MKSQAGGQASLGTEGNHEKNIFNDIYSCTAGISFTGYFDCVRMPGFKWLALPRQRLHFGMR